MSTVAALAADIRRFVNWYDDGRGDDLPTRLAAALIESGWTTTRELEALRRQLDDAQRDISSYERQIEECTCQP